MNVRIRGLYALVLAYSILLGSGILSAQDAAVAQQAPEVIFDEALGAADYGCAVWFTPWTYAGDIPGETDDAIKGLSPQKWYFVVTLFDGVKVVKTIAFPGALLVNQADFEKFKPSFMKIVSRPVDQVGYWRYLLTIENGWLFKYNLMAERDSAGNPWTSVDFGRRTPLFVADAIRVDGSFFPVTDKDDNIFFKTTDGKFRKWDSSSETASIMVGNPPPGLADRPVSFAMAGDQIQIKGQSTVYMMNPNVNVDEVIDPLGIQEEKIVALYTGYGTPAYLIPNEDYSMLLDYYQLPLGKVLEANAVLASGQKLMFQETDPQASAEFEKVIREIGQGYNNKVALIRELKKIMREKGVFSVLKKWLTESEVQSIVAALSPQEGGGGVIQTAPLDKDATRMSIVVDAKPTLTWGYYRMLKDYARKGFDQASWENFSKDKLDGLVAAIRAYAGKIINAGVLADTITRFQALGERSDWPTWFEKNDDLLIELMFDYMTTLDENTINQALTQAGAKQIWQRRFLMILDMYKRSKLFFGVSAAQ